MRKVLILGGTGLARDLAGRLLDDGHDVTSSLAGVTRNPARPPGNVRTGGFGGTRSLQNYLQQEAFGLVVDATHAFARTMSANAVEACSKARLPLIRLEPPAWSPLGGDRWHAAEDVAEAVRLLAPGSRTFLTIGRTQLAAFFARAELLSGLARMIEPPDLPVPEGWHIVLARPPFPLAEERDLMAKNGVTVLVSKNAGGARPAKLDAARELGLPVVMIARPQKPPAVTFGSVDQLADHLNRETK